MKKRKCMADGGMPQERAKTPDETPEWKKSLAAAWQAIAGDAPKRVSKESSIAALRALIVGKGAEVDDEILEKLTGKAAVYFAAVLSA